MGRAKRRGKGRGVSGVPRLGLSRAHRRPAGGRGERTPASHGDPGAGSRPGAGGDHARSTRRRRLASRRRGGARRRRIVHPRARDDVRRSAAMLADLHRYARTGSASSRRADRRSRDVVADLRATGRRRVFVASYLLAHGLFQQHLESVGADGVGAPTRRRPRRRRPAGSAGTTLRARLWRLSDYRVARPGDSTTTHECHRRLRRAATPRAGRRAPGSASAPGRSGRRWDLRRTARRTRTSCP